MDLYTETKLSKAVEVLGLQHHNHAELFKALGGSD